MRLKHHRPQFTNFNAMFLNLLLYLALFSLLTTTAAEKSIQELNDISKVKAKIENSGILFNNQNFPAFDASEKVLSIRTNSAFLTMVLIYQQMRERKSVQSIIFINSAALKNDEMLNNVINAHKSHQKPILVVSCDEGETVIEIRKNIEENQRLIFVVDDKLSLNISDTTSFSVDHSWSDLTTESKEKLMKSQINFQGNFVTLREIVSEKSNVFNNSDFLNFFVDEENLKLGKRIDFENFPTLIERKFLSVDLERDSKNGTVFSFDQIMDLFEENKVFGINGGCEALEFKRIIQKLKQKFPFRWVSFIDLNVHNNENELLDIFNYVEDRKKRSFSEKNQSKVLGEKFLKLKGFELDIFIDLIANNRVIFLINYNRWGNHKFMAHVIKSLESETKNIVLISNCETLQKSHNFDFLYKEKVPVKTFKLLPFSDKDKNAFLNNVLSTKNINADKFEPLFETTTKISHQKDSLSVVFVEMLAELLATDINFDFSKLNYFSFFKTFVEKKIENFAPQDHGKIYKAHEKLAFDILHPHESSNWVHMPNISFEAITNVGLIAYENNQFQFVHKIYADFFVANFIAVKIFEEKFKSENEKKNVIKLFFSMLHLDKYGENENEMTRMFLNYAFDNLAREKLSQDDSMRNILRTSFQEFPTSPVLTTANLTLTSLVEFLSINLETDKKGLQKLWFPTGDQLKFHSTSFLSCTAQFESLPAAKKFLKVAKKVFTTEELKKLFLYKPYDKRYRSYDDRHNIFYFAALNVDFEIFQYLFDEAKLLFSTDFEFLIEIIPTIPDNGKFQKSLQFLKQKLNGIEYKYALNSTHGANLNLIHRACDKMDTKSFGTIVAELKENLSQEEIQNLILSETNHTETTFMSAMRNDAEGFVGAFIKVLSENLNMSELKKCLAKKYKGELTALHAAAQLQSFQNFELVKQFYLQTFDKSSLKEIIKIDILFTRTRKGKKEILESLWGFVQEIYDVTETKELLMKNKRSFNENLKLFLPFIIQHCNFDEKRQFALEIVGLAGHNWLNIEDLFSAVNVSLGFDFYKQLFQTKNDENENILIIAMRNSYNPSLLELLIKNSKSFLTSEELVESLLVTNSKKNFILYSSIDSKEGFENTIRVLKKNLNNQEFRSVSMQSDIDGRTFVHYALEFPHSLHSMFSEEKDDKLYWTSFVAFIDEILSHKEIRELLQKQTADGTNGLMIAAKKFGLKEFQVYWSFLEREFSPEDLKDMLQKENSENSTVLRFATLNDNEKVFDMVKSLGEKYVGVEETKQNYDINAILFWAAKNVKEKREVRNFWNFIIKSFDNALLRTLLLKPNDEGFTAFEVGKRSNNLNFIERRYFNQAIFNTFSKDELKQISKIIGEARDDDDFYDGLFE